MTPAEMALVIQLGECWNAFCLLPKEHEWEGPEFMGAIHRAQDVVAARAGYRQMNQEPA